MIEGTKRNGDEFEVMVEKGGSSTSHTVTVDDDYHQKLTGGEIGKEELVRRSFEFLLEREPKESILSRFNLKVITRYFPSYETQIKP
mgnify:CR=1 FL=1